MDDKEERKNYIDKNFPLEYHPRIYEIDLSDSALGEINNKLPCFITFHEENSIIYNNSNLYIIHNYKYHHDIFIKIFQKLKIIPFPSSIKKELLSIKSTINVINDDEINFLQKAFDEYKNIFFPFKSKYPLFNLIYKLISFSIFYNNMISDRNFKISQFQIFDNISSETTQQIAHYKYDGFSSSNINYSTKIPFFTISKEFDKECYYHNEKKFIEYLNKFREKKCKTFKFYNNINYDSNFPIINSFNSSKNGKIICEFIPNINIYIRYQKNFKEISLTEKLLTIINCCRSMNLIHSFGFIYRDLSPQNYFFKNSQSKIPILFNLSVVMPMKMLNEKDSIYTENMEESCNIGWPYYFAPEKYDSSDSGISFTSDIFSFGIFIFYAILGYYSTKSNSLYKIHEFNKTDNFLSLKNEFNNLKETKSELINSDSFLLQDDDINALEDIYINCIKFDPRKRLTIREISINLIIFTQMILQKDYIQRNLDSNDLIDIKNCMLGLTDELSSPIPYIIGLSDSYYAYTTTNELENFNFFLIDHEIVFDSALFYISQIKASNFGTFHFDIIDSKIHSLTLCIEKYAIIIRNTRNLIHDFIQKFYSTLKQIKLIPSSENDNSIFKSGKFIDESENDLVLIEWELIQNLIDQIEKVVLPHIERKNKDLIEPKTYSLIPLISYLIIENYFVPSRERDEIKQRFIELELDNQKLFLDLESFALTIEEKTNIKINNSSISLLQENLFNASKQSYYRYFPYNKYQNKLPMMTEEEKCILIYKVAYGMKFIQNNNFYLKSLNFSDLYFYPNKNVLDFNIRMNDNLAIITKEEEKIKNFELFKEFIEKVNSTKLNELIQKFSDEQNLTFEFINNYLYSNIISDICNSIQLNIANLSNLSFNSLPSTFNGNDLFPSKFLDYYSTNIFNFDFYDISYIDTKKIKIIIQTQKLPFITYEFIDDDKFFVFCTENKCFFLKNCSKDLSKNKINDIFDCLFQKNKNVTLIPIKQSDIEKFPLKLFQNNFFNNLSPIIIQKSIDKIKQKIILQINEKNRFTEYSKYSQFTNNFLCDFFSILSPVIAYTFFRHYFPSNSFEDDSFFHFYKESNTGLIDFAKDRESMIDIAAIGNGSTSLIYLSCHLPSIHPLVIKEYNSRMFKYFYTEKKIGTAIKKTNDKNSLANFYGFIDKKNKKSIIMKFYPNGSFDDFKLESKFTEKEILEMRHYIITYGIDVLSSLNYSHHDINPSNILFDNNFNPVIIDFNGSCKINDNKCDNYKGDIESLYSIIPFN